MSFKDDFPSMANHPEANLSIGWYDRDIENEQVYFDDMRIDFLKETCIDKQKIREAIKKLTFDVGCSEDCYGQDVVGVEALLKELDL